MARRSFDLAQYVPTRVKPWFKWILFWRRLSPAALLLLSFVVLIALGTLGLVFIPGLQAEEPLSAVDALFTITSAVCVTGLTVTDTATHFTGWGQAWLLVCMQLGGIGLITLTTLLIGALGKQLSLRSEMLAVAPTRKTDRPEVFEVAAGVAKFSLAIEAVGVMVLFLLWVPHYGAGEAAWHAVFHSISAYCNAGLSTFAGGLARFHDMPLTLIAISLLVILGGLGYLTFEELLRWWRSATARRSGGFNTVDYANVGNDSATLTMLLMFIGGSPGSMAGGIKTTTVAVVIALGLSRMRGQRFVGLKDRAIPDGTIERTIGVILLFVFVLVVSFFILGAIQSSDRTAMESRGDFLPMAFEVLSAFTTTGLSMTATSELYTPSKMLLIVLMFIGRVGLFSFFTTLMLRRSQPPAFVRPAQEDVIVG